MLKTCGANIGDDNGIVYKVLKSDRLNLDTATAEQEEHVEEVGHEWYYALTFLMDSNWLLFGRLIEKLKNLRGMTTTPKHVWPPIIGWSNGTRIQGT